FGALTVVGVLRWHPFEVVGELDDPLVGVDRLRKKVLGGVGDVEVFLGVAPRALRGLPLVLVFGLGFPGLVGLGIDPPVVADHRALGRLTVFAVARGVVVRQRHL